MAASAGALLLLLVPPSGEAAKPPPRLSRAHEPVVLAGARLTALAGTVQGRLLAYRYRPGRRPRWVRVPVQLDERTVVDFGSSPFGAAPTAPTVYGTLPVGAAALQYTDPGTFVGADPVPGLDADDEVVFMSADAGPRAPRRARLPRGVRRGRAIRVLVRDPLSSARGWIYLFRSRRTVGEGRRDYVDYSFNLLSGDYRTTYSRGAGPNPESSTVTTADYRLGFTDRWIFDQLGITAGAATGVDILDGYKSGFAPGQCGRSEDTYSAGEGAFAVNKDGPVRAIRAYVGANSGPYTERTHYFYARRHEIVTDLRVHPIGGIFTQHDLSPAGIGMTYLDQMHPGGVPVDGVQDPIDGGPPSAWHLWRGDQGSLFVGDRVRSSFLAAFAAGAIGWYLDDSTPAIAQCWGDSQQIGAAGVRYGAAIPGTEPGDPDFLQARTVGIVSGPGLSASEAAMLSSQLDFPLVTSVRRLRG